MQAYFWKFAKEYNSTARPNLSSATQVEIELKQPSSIINPSMFLHGAFDVTMNYCYVPTLHRYYNIDGVRWASGLWEISCMVDVLASWRDEIGAQSLYVLRSSAENDGNIVDSMYPATTDVTAVIDSADNPFFAYALDDGIFSVGIATSGGTEYYLFTKNALTSFVNYLFSDAYAEAAVPTWSSVFPQLKAELNPLQYITSVMWLPIQNTGANAGNINVGYVSVPSGAMIMPGTVVTKAGSVSFGNHPQVSRGSYLNYAPYAHYDIFVPGFGVIPISPERLSDRTVTYYVLMDMRTGSGTLSLVNSDNCTIGTYHSQLGIPYQLSQVINRGYGLGDILSPALSIGAAAISDNAAGVITGAMSAIRDAAASQVPQVRTIGTTGGADSLRGKVTAHAYYYNVVAEDMSHRGRPLCQMRTLSTIPGFIMCSDADIKIAATEQEQEQIRNLLEGGFIYV